MKGTVIVRLKSNDSNHEKTLMDAGAHGIDKRIYLDDAKFAIESTRYEPKSIINRVNLRAQYFVLILMNF